MDFDISNLLDQWDYQPGQVVVRRFKAKDGREKIQLRVDLGLLQMNAQGRPDGKHPYGRESLLEYYQGQMEKFQKERRGDEKSYRLTPEDCGRLQQEAIQYHHRYICLFQLEDFDGVLREPRRYGIENTTDKCAGRALFDEDATPCAKPSAYFTNITLRAKK